MDAQLRRRGLLKVDNSDILYSLRKQYIITFGKLMLKQHEDEQDALLKTMKQIKDKLSEYDKPVSYDPHDDNSFIYTYLKEVDEMFAELQMHYGIDINQVSIARFYTLRNAVERKFKAGTPKKGISDMPTRSI